MQTLRLKSFIDFIMKLIFPSTKKVYMRRIDLMGVKFLNTTMQK